MTPIRAADDLQRDGVAAMLARFEALDVVSAALARIAGQPHDGGSRSLATTADMAGAIARMPTTRARHLAIECDSIARALTAGLMAIERGRQAGRLNPSAAQLHHAESGAAIGNVRNTLMYYG